MCGILGAYNRTDTPIQFSESQFTQAMDLMSYRGPDSRGQWADASQKVRLGHLRLSILDPRPEGAQPMHLMTPNGKLSMVFNGEVYNYREIREELREMGWTFNTETDSEVVLVSYAVWGVDCVKRFNGMFAIAIYNDKTQELFLLRDRLGIKPLYYHQTSDGIIFASEMKAIQSLIGHGSLQTPLIHQYMNYGYITGTDTLDGNIKKLPPAHYLILAPNKLETTVRYWNIERKFTPINNITEESEWLQSLERTLCDAIELRLRADVPVGVFLSGGLDSSLVVALLAKRLNRPLKTFSVRYSGDEYGDYYDESVYAEKVSKLFGTEHTTYTMDSASFEKYIPEYVRVMDEPVTEAASIALHYLSEVTKDHVTVVLSGEGADELFAGYDLYRYMITLERIRKAITPIGAQALAKLARQLPNGHKIRKYAEMMAEPFEKRYRGISIYDSSYQDKLYQESFKSQQPKTAFTDSIMQQTAGKDLLSRMLEFDTRTWLPDDLLIKADRMSMASSLELRVPFLDYRMVEMAAKTPSNMKIRNGSGKWALKKIAERYLPDEIVHREKRGFPSPLARMFQGPLKGYTIKHLVDDADSPLAAFFHMDEIKRICEEHWSKQADHHRLLWQLLVLNEWLKQFNEVN